MTQTEMKDKFEALYNYMASSNEPRYMKLFGEVMVEMMDWMIKNQPTAAEQWIETLCAIKWEQYLTKSEALTVFNTLKPKGAWALDIWRKAMEDLGLETEREYVFNCYSLWIVMNAIHSDNGAVIAGLLGIEPTDVTNPKYIKTIHRMAVNTLTDDDGFFDVRSYYLG